MIRSYSLIYFQVFILYQYFFANNTYSLKTHTLKMNQSTPIPTHAEPQNDREFKCKCSKIYKSYPALYTHIKNKHFEKIQEFKSQSKRPKDNQIEKGRPKKHRQRPAQADEQGDLLNIIELGILEIEQNLRNQVYASSHSQKFQILQGNTKLNEEDLNYHYKHQKVQVIDKILENVAEDQNDQIISRLNERNLSDLKNEESVRIYKEQIKFKNELVQHFNAVTAAKILLHLELIETEEEPVDQSTNINGQINLPDSRTMVIKVGEQALWGRNQAIIKVIRNIHSQWHQKLNSMQGHFSQSERQSLYSPQQEDGSSSQSSQNNQQEQEEYINENKVQNDMLDSCIS